MSFSELIRLTVAVAMAATTVPICADELGVIGPTYAIGEESALETILKRLKQAQRSGKLKDIQQAAIKRSLHSAKNPREVEGITAVLERSQRLIDPTVTYTKAIKTDEGEIVVPAGAKINPLLVTTLSKRLVFFDGRDQAQSEAVRKLVSTHSTKVKPILVAGSWYDLTKAWGAQVYYDQQGRLSRRFGVRAVPTVISQQGNLLLLEEVPAKDLQ